MAKIMNGHLRRSFKDILANVESQNASRLMRKARIANRLAKTITGGGRARAYRAKANALVALSRAFPERVFVSEDPRTPSFVLVRNVKAKFGLHAPAHMFRGEALAREAA